jgi:aminoacrylate hydrolase
MATLKTNGISLYYELIGNPANPPVLMISGLGGVGKSWGPQVKLFSEKYYLILPDQRGTGQTTHADDGYSTIELAEDMAALIKELKLGPVHVAGASTGGAIAQYLALNYPELVRSITISSSFARFDGYMHRQFSVRRKMVEEWDGRDMYEGFSLFLFCPTFTREHPEKVNAWIERAATNPRQENDREIGLKRIDMIASHDAFPRLNEIKHPVFIICGNKNMCTPLPLSEEIAHAIPQSEFVVIDEAGELIELEKPEEYFEQVSGFIDRH